MEGLFIIEGNKVMPNPELIMLEPFRIIWDTFQKELALDVIGYCYFMVSYSTRNPFVGYEPELKSGQILSSLPSGPEIQQLMADGLDLKPAMILLDELQEEASHSMRFYKAALAGTEKMISFFNTFDLSAVSSKTGLPLYKPADITRALKETSEVLKTLQGLRDKVMQETLDASRATKKRIVNPFER
jgi:hypothetical protein